MSIPPAPLPGLPLGSDGYPAAGGVARRPAGVEESARANRRGWDAAAPAYLAEHGADLGDTDFLWGPEGLREADAHLLGPIAGRDRQTLRREGARAWNVRAVLTPGAGNAIHAPARGLHIRRA